MTWYIIITDNLKQSETGKLKVKIISPLCFQNKFGEKKMEFKMKWAQFEYISHSSIIHI